MTNENRIKLLIMADCWSICCCGKLEKYIGLLMYFSSLPQQQMLQQSAIINNLILFSLVITFISGAVYKGVNAYDAFIEGAKEGFQTAIIIIPYLVAMLVA